MIDIATFIEGLPKAELHLHIEGTGDPELLFEFSRRNNTPLPFDSVEAMIAAQDYGEPALKNFLDYHYSCIKVIQTYQDFYELTLNFLKRCQKENVRHAEVSFDPQMHLEREIPFDTFFLGIKDGCDKGLELYGVSTTLIMSFERDFPVENSLEVLEMATPWREHITGIGLDSYEVGNPPIKFKTLFDRARAKGYRLTAHCDCDVPDSIKHIRQCIEILGVERIDHGVNCVESPEIMEILRERQICLTMCPTWRPSDSGPRRLPRTRQIFDFGIPVTINTDDPAEFASGYMNNTCTEVALQTPYSHWEMVRFSEHAFRSSWIPESLKETYLEELYQYASQNNVFEKDIA